MKMTVGQRWVLALTSLAGLMIVLDALVVTTALHAIQLDLHASLGALEWTINAYNLSFAVLLMAGAALGDRYGRRRVLASGLTVFTVASAGCALAPNLGWLIAARTAQGIGAAAIMPVAVALLSAAFEPAQRTRALGLFAATTGLGTLGGPLLGGAVVQGLTWQWIFWINVPIGVLLVPLVRTRLPESFGLARRLDYAGIALVSIAAFGLVWGLIRGNESGWAGTEVVTAFVIGAAALAGFIRWESHTAAPLVPMGFFVSRAFSAGNAAGFLLTASIFSGAFFFTQFLQVVMGYGPLGAGLRLAPWTVTLFLIAPVAGRRVNRFGERPLVVLGLVMQAAGFGWIALIARPDLPYPMLLAPFVIAGIGASMAIPSAQSAVLRAVPMTAVGAASGTYSALRQLGGAFGIAVPAAVFAAVGSFASAQAFTDGFAAATVTAALLAVLGALLGLLIPAGAPVPDAVVAALDAEQLGTPA
ncbi:DHA2 family efflux MFS transporter permease subunit [Nocardia sp. NBC_01503]|uniref:DHA2 family efflux MFS transporter permease subunit n=1 Tax=Nocardia sp. NBC_01503 TaxID=2975997 RepID=UPI002E7B2DA5|nr:DHA2 family efflux MFS transporter permease subunit [Nocardia sp. NBC_01503]WTL31284.1 DHA2 family efflux MFS transporter permease subunit [Nocardia sp. NBC_01503]